MIPSSIGVRPGSQRNMGLHDDAMVPRGSLVRQAVRRPRAVVALHVAATAPRWAARFAERYAGGGGSGTATAPPGAARRAGRFAGGGRRGRGRGPPRAAPG